MHLTTISHNDKKGDKKRSDKTILKFVEVAKQFGFNVSIVEDNTYENGKLGVDAWIIMGNNKFAIDVKSKCTKGKDLFVLEQQNNMGETGSVFKTNTEFFVFERDDHFALYKTEDLRKLYTEKVNINESSIVSNHPACWDSTKNRPVLYKTMNRSNYNRKKDGKPNNDRFAYFHFDDLQFIAWTKLPFDYKALPTTNPSGFI